MRFVCDSNQNRHSKQRMHLHLERSHDTNQVFGVRRWTSSVGRSDQRVGQTTSGHVQQQRAERNQRNTSVWNYGSSSKTLGLSGTGFCDRLQHFVQRSRISAMAITIHRSVSTQSSERCHSRSLLQSTLCFFQNSAKIWRLKSEHLCTLHSFISLSSTFVL